MENRVKEAIEVFIKAIDTQTLVKGTCSACAVGNLVAFGMGAEIEKERNYLAYKGGILVDNVSWYIPRDEKNLVVSKGVTKFTDEELAQIEHTFESNTKISYIHYNIHTYSEILNDQIKGLEAVSYTHLTLPTTPYV